MVIVVMGVAGSGKTTVGRLLAQRLGATFVEGDDHHPRGNLEKMRAGIPLDDADRRPWLLALAARVDECRAGGSDAVVACSALKRSYRELLIGSRPDARLVYLHGSRELLAARLAGRADHFFSSALLESQLAALEPPASEEAAVEISAADPPEHCVERIARALGA